MLGVLAAGYVLPRGPLLESDKLAHAAAYALVAAGWLFAIHPTRIRPCFGALLSWTVSTGWGALDEFLQIFAPGRQGSWTDLVADGVGASIPAAAYAIVIAMGRRGG